jgi:hypothetical protein
MGARASIVAVGAQLLVLVHYYFQYTGRAAFSVVMPQLKEACGVDAADISAIVGFIHYGCSPFSLVAGGAHRPTRREAIRLRWRGALRRCGIAIRHRQRGLCERGAIPARRRRRVPLIGVAYLITRNYYTTPLAASFIVATICRMAGWFHQEG